MTTRDKLKRLRGDLTNCIAANGAYRGDSAIVANLAGFTTQLRRWLALVEMGLREPHRTEDIASRLTSANWRGPQIADVIHQSQAHRDPWMESVVETVTVERKAA